MPVSRGAIGARSEATDGARRGSLRSADGPLSRLCGRQHERLAVLQGLRIAPRAGRARDDHRGAEDRHGAVLRPRSASPRRARAPTPRTSPGCSPGTSRWRARRSSSTAASSRSSSATPWWGCSACPVAHGDDPERAVRAALRIVDEAAKLRALGDSPLRLRVGINTGPALVRLDATPGAGEHFLTGDSVNTASRIQSVAPEMGVAVGAETWEATRQRFEYEELPPATLKGKAEPVRIFHAKAPRASLGIDVTRGHTGPFVGRAAELRTLTDLLDATVVDRLPAVRDDRRRARPGQEPPRRRAAGPRRHAPGPHHLAAGPLPARTARGSRSGRWARSSRRRPASSTRTTRRSRPRSSTRRCPRARNAPGSGNDSSRCSASSPGRAPERDEQFTAWRRFLELMAGQRPTVLVVEDLHWADPAMLAFLDELEANAASVPLLVLGTTRPEARPPRVEGGPDRAPAAPRRRGGGPPADAVRDVVDRPGAPRRRGRARRGQPAVRRGVRPPPSRPRPARGGRRRDHAASRCGAARSRSRSRPSSRPASMPSRRPGSRALGDAAVIGKVFWAGAVAAMGDLRGR